MGENVRPIRGRSRSTTKVRMTGQERRAQLLDVGRRLFSERGYEATSIEEIANRAGVSKPVVYEHFGGKEGLYAVVVDRETQRLLHRITNSLDGDEPHTMLQQAANALLSYIEDEPHGFRILVHGSPVGQTSGTFASLIVDVASKVEYVLANEFEARGYDPELAPLYSQALVGMVALVGQWWLDARRPSRDEVAAHLVNLAWNGLRHLDPKPLLRAGRRKRRDERAAERAAEQATGTTGGVPVPPASEPGAGGTTVRLPGKPRSPKPS